MGALTHPAARGGRRIHDGGSCPCCASPGRVRYRGLTDRLFGVSGRWDVARCASPACDLMWIHPRPAADEIAGFYATYYTHGDAPSEEISGWVHWVRATMFPTPSSARRLRQRRTQVLPDSLGVAGRHILEIGCGNGVNLLALRKLGWNVSGHELDPTAADVASRRLGMHVERGPVEQVDWGDRRFDVVLTNHVLEHLGDPEAVVSAAAGLLLPGGVMVNFTPNSASASRAMFGARWRGFEPPRHLQVYGPASVRSLLAAAGLEVERVETSAASDGYLASRSLLPSDGRFVGVLRIPVSVCAQVIGDLCALLRPLAGGELMSVARRSQPAPLEEV